MKGYEGRNPHRAFAAAAVAAVLLVGVSGHPARATSEGVTEGVSPASWFSVGALTGVVKLDPKLADYQWDTTPRLAWGLEVLAGRGRVATGLRFLRTETTQEIGVPGALPAASVGATSLEFIGQGRLVTLWGNQVMAVGSVGRVHLGYNPDRIAIDPTGSGSTIEVEFNPVDEWIVGGGLAVKRSITRDWVTGLEVDYRVFSLETAHRIGDSIETGRESFGDWSARLAIAWQYGW